MIGCCVFHTQTICFVFRSPSSAPSLVRTPIGASNAFPLPPTVIVPDKRPAYSPKNSPTKSPRSGPAYRISQAQSASSISIYSQDSSEEDQTPTPRASPTKKTRSSTHTTASPVISPFALRVDTAVPNGHRSSGPKPPRSPGSMDPRASSGVSDDEGLVSKASGDEEADDEDDPIIPTSFGPVNFSRANPAISAIKGLQAPHTSIAISPINLANKAYRKPEQVAQDAGSLFKSSLAPTFELMPSSPKRPSRPTRPPPLSPPPKPPQKGMLHIVLDSDSDPSSSEECECKDCTMQELQKKPTTPGLKFSRVVDSVHAMRPLTILEEKESMRSASGGSSTRRLLSESERSGSITMDPGMTSDSTLSSLYRARGDLTVSVGYFGSHGAGKSQPTLSAWRHKLASPSQPAPVEEETQQLSTIHQAVLAMIDQSPTKASPSGVHWASTIQSPPSRPTLFSPVSLSPASTLRLANSSL